MVVVKLVPLPWLTLCEEGLSEIEKSALPIPGSTSA